MDVTGILGPPALALLDEGGRVLRSTEAFDRHHAERRLDLDAVPELRAVLSGQAASADVTIGGERFSVEPVDGGGLRRLLLSEAGARSGGAASNAPPAVDPLVLLRDELAQSPALAWLKDLEGRYTYVNPRFVEELKTSEETVVGHGEEELPPLQTVDGPRVKLGQESSPEPRQLEYTVPAYEGRTSFAALRFVVLDAEGKSAGVCGVAAPLDSAQLAREEAGRLMRLQRWCRMDADAVRLELLAEWGVAPGEADASSPASEPPPAAPESPSHPAPPSPAPPPASDVPIVLPSDLGERWETCVQQLLAEAGRWLAELDRARAAVEQAQGEANAARAELEQLRAERDELQRALEAERERGLAVVQALGQVRARIADLDSTVDQALTVEVPAT